MKRSVAARRRVAILAAAWWACGGGCADVGENPIGDARDGSGDAEGDGAPGADSDSGADSDAGPDGDGTAPDDAAGDGDGETTLLGFGEPCTDNTQCDTGMCVFSGATGVCTRWCAGDDCPEGWGCYGVWGLLDPGELTDACVPENTRLCTPCERDAECSAATSDLCLDFPSGGRFCGRDCTTIECPAGYGCEVVSVAGRDYRQCMPVTGACDCDASREGEVRACVIDTPFGACAGERTCLGAAGWGACLPPSATDTPDGTFADDNCDGIDGDIDDGIFVAVSGADMAACGLWYDNPCATVTFGVLRAVEAGLHNVYVQAGDYRGVVVLGGGIHVWGGFDAGWQRDTRSALGHEVTLRGEMDADEGQYLTVRAHRLLAPTTVADLTIVAPDASGVAGSSARGSYAVHVEGSMALALARVTIRAGSGAVGPSGSYGADAPSTSPTAGMGGSGGGAAHEGVYACNTSDHGAGGSPGSNSCGSGAATAGGRGGDGGEMDTSCFLGVCSNCSSTAGDGGSNAAQVGGTSGLGGLGGARGGDSGFGGEGGAGYPGVVTNGAAGRGGAAGGFLTGPYWYARPGTAGATGANGGGGGGGGGSGGSDNGIDSWGAGGGGGGAGGCTALGAGGPGGGGGGSFGIFAYSSTVNLSDCEIQRGNGGNGGPGGAGGRGQSGGGGGTGGLPNGESLGGGGGAAGGHGGHGGGGGGGSGGVSFGVYTYSSTVGGACTQSGGTPGAAGVPGVAAPTAPVPERDGNNGTAGAAGTMGDSGGCLDPSGC